MRKKPSGSVAVPTASSSAYLDGTADHVRFKRCQAIRDRYADGQPLAGADMQLLVSVLHRHPRAKQKIGPGIHAIAPGRYIGGSRCFFVIRTDGGIEDFSIRKCLNRPMVSPSARVASAMACFSYVPLRRAFLAYRRTVRAGTEAGR